MDNETDGVAAAPEETAAAPATEDSAQVENTELEATASEEDGGDDTASPEEGKKPAKGVQKRLDELTRQKHETARDRDYWRELAMRQAAPQPEQAPQRAQQAPPQEDQFEDYESFQRALTRYELKQELAQEQNQQTAAQKAQSFQERVNAKAAEMPDFASVVYDPAVPITDTMREVILDSELGAEVAYFLGTNLSEAQRIAALSPHRQAAELGKLETKLSAPKTPPTPRTPPPAPPKTVSGLSAGLTKPAEDMTMAEYVEARKNGQL